MTPLPDLIGWRAVVLHRPDAGVERLVRQLGLLGLSAAVRWQPLDLAETPADVVLVDADQGFDDLLPWGEGPAPLPVVALLQSEAPGRVAFALGKGAGAVIAKPVAAAAVYPALVLAAAVHAERRAAAERIARLEERVRLRPLVHAAVRALIEAEGLGEDAAYRRLRAAAMGRRLTIEQVAAEWVAGGLRRPEAG